MSEAPAPAPAPALPIRKGPGGGTWLLGLAIGIVGTILALYLGEAVACPTCQGTGRAIGRGGNVRWTGTTSGVECLPCDGQGVRRRYTTWFEEER